MKESRGVTWLERVAFYAFIASGAFAVFAYGYAVGSYGIFPRSVLKTAKEGFLELKTQSLRFLGLEVKWLPWWYPRAEEPHPAPIYNADRAYKGLNLVTAMGANLEFTAKVMDMDGHTVHEWNTDWFRIWPNVSHLPEDLVPKSKPGAHIHGAVVVGNGDLIFNFSPLGMVRLNRRSEVVWRLPYQTHHSVHLDEDENLWVCGLRRHEKQDPRQPWRKPPFDEQTVVVVSPNGQVLYQWSIPEILLKNNLAGLCENGQEALGPTGTYTDGGLHLNDVEPFPETMEEGVFKHGDVMVSLRNVNTVFVFNRETEKIKYISIGRFIRQHDPDFIDGNRFSVFDNGTAWRGTRIMVVSARDDSMWTAYEGNTGHRFFTSQQGKHQWFPNGNLLNTDARNGRAFEVNRNGEIVWEYRNYVDEGVLGLVTEVTRLPERYAEIFR